MTQMTPGQVAPDRGWWGSAPGAEVAAAGMLLIQLSLWIVTGTPGEDYGMGWGIGAVLFLPVVFVLTPLLLLAVGFLHAAVFTRPALALARRTGRPSAAAAWILASSAACALLFWSPRTPYLVNWAVIAGVAVPPLLVAHHAIRRNRPVKAVVTVTGVVSGVLGLVTLVGGFVVFGEGVLAAHRPPRLERAQYVGEWHGEDGGVVRLGEGGEVTVRGVPVARGFGPKAVCAGTGTWTWRDADPRWNRRAGVDMTVPGCEDWDRVWEVAGTEEHPELFQFFGDPDNGDMWLLRRTGAAAATHPHG